MLKLRRHNSGTVDFYGFTLQKGYWYGIDTDTNQKIATSGWETYDGVYADARTDLAVYYLQPDGSWKRFWVDESEVEIEIENLPKLHPKALSFEDWLIKKNGMTLEDYHDLPSREEEIDYFYNYYKHLYRIEGSMPVFMFMALNDEGRV